MNHLAKKLQLTPSDSGHPLPRFPADFPRTPGNAHQPEVLDFSLPEAQTLAPLAERGIDVQAALLAAFNLLIYRYTGQDCFQLRLALLGYGSGQDYSWEVTIRFAAQSTVRQLTLQAAEHFAACLAAHSRQPATAEAEAAAPASRPPLPLALTFCCAEKDAQKLALRFMESGDEREIHLAVLNQADGFSGLFIYNASLFRRDTIRRLAVQLRAQLRVLLAAMRRDIDHPAACLSMLDADEIRQLTESGRAARRDYPALPLHRYIERHALTQPAALAASFGAEQLSYTELNRRANQLAGHLIQSGIGPGDAVAVCVQPSLDILVCLLGIFKAGAVHVPLDPSYPSDRLSGILQDTRARLLLTQSALLGQLPALSLSVLCLDRDRSTLDALPATNIGLEPGPEQAAVIIYTSGTTGTPKGVVLSHANLIHYILAARERYGFNRLDVMPAMARFSFSISLFELLCPLVSGGRVLILERDHVLDFRRLVQTMQQVTVMHASPSLWRKLLAYARDSAIPASSFSGLRHVSSGGDMVSADLIESLKQTFERAEIFVIYGCSEISCMGCTYPVPGDRTVRRSLVGKPFANVSLRLYDEQQNLVPVGIPGEVYFSGAGVASGYLGREALTAERFILIDGQRFYRTGDIGRFDAEGNLELLGRSDFQIKLRGMRIELGEIEFTLRQAPGVRESVVVACKLENDETALIAYIVLARALAPTLPEVRHFLRTKLPDYMVPGIFVVLDALPVNLNQKLDRRALPAPTAEQLAQFATALPPRTELERRLLAIWQSVLARSAIGISDNFFDVGGDSLLSVSLMIEIEKAFGKTLPLSTILTAPSIEQQAALLGSEQAVRPPVVLLRDENAALPVFFVHDGDGEILPYRNLALRLSPGHAVYGLQPYGSDGYPILHTRLAEMVDYYTAQIRGIQPEGPYLLGGLCIGGFIAFEIARKLQQNGERVGMVALIDAAHVKATARSLAGRRIKRFSAAILQDHANAGILQRVGDALLRTAKKVFNAAAYEMHSRSKRSRNWIKLRLFRWCLDHHHRLPNFLQNIAVADVLRFAEKEYRVPEQYAGEVLLLRATEKDRRFDGTAIDDTPYVELFAEPTLGWDKRSSGLRIHDIPGGHSSMLQEPYATTLAKLIQSYMDTATAKAQSG